MRNGQGVSLGATAHSNTLLVKYQVNFLNVLQVRSQTTVVVNSFQAERTTDKRLGEQLMNALLARCQVNFLNALQVRSQVNGFFIIALPVPTCFVPRLQGLGTTACCTGIHFLDRWRFDHNQLQIGCLATNHPNIMMSICDMCHYVNQLLINRGTITIQVKWCLDS